MRNFARWLLIVGFVAAAGPSLAQQVDFFKIEMSGLEHCADLDNFKFNARNNVDMWVRIIDDQEWDFALSPLFLEADTIPMIGHTYVTSSKKFAFTGAQFIGTTGFLAVDATAQVDKNALVSKISGTFIQDTGADDPNSPPACISAGKFKSTERTLVNP